MRKGGGKPANCLNHEKRSIKDLLPRIQESQNHRLAKPKGGAEKAIPPGPSCKKEDWLNRKRSSPHEEKAPFSSGKPKGEICERKKVAILKKADWPL